MTEQQHPITPSSLAEQALADFKIISELLLEEYTGCEVHSKYVEMVNVINSAIVRLQQLEQINDN